MQGGCLREGRDPMCGEEVLCVGRNPSVRGGGGSVRAEIYFYDRRLTFLVLKASALLTEDLLPVQRGFPFTQKGLI